MGIFFPEELTLISIATFILIGMIRMFLIFVLGFKMKNQGVSKILVVPLFIFGFVYDVFLNYWATLLFLDTPKKWDETITKRMTRYKANEPISWRGRFSHWMCSKLNAYDKGHC